MTYKDEPDQPITAEWLAAHGATTTIDGKINKSYWLMLGRHIFYIRLHRDGSCDVLMNLSDFPHEIPTVARLRALVYAITGEELA